MTYSVWAVLLATVLYPQSTDVQKDGHNQEPPTNYATPANPHPAAVSQQGTNNRQTKKQNHRQSVQPFLPWCKRYRDVIDVLSAACVAAFTGILTLFTVKLWRSGEKHSARTLRAYLFFESAHIHPINSGDYVRALIEVTNGGQTPAYKVSSRSEIWIDLPTPTGIREMPEAMPGSMSIGPNGHLDVKPVSSWILSEDQFNKIEIGDLAIYVVARVKYTDAFEQEQVSQFSGYFCNNLQEVSLDGPLQLRTSKKGNEYT